MRLKIVILAIVMAVAAFGLAVISEQFDRGKRYACDATVNSCPKNASMAVRGFPFVDRTVYISDVSQPQDVININYRYPTFQRGRNINTAIYFSCLIVIVLFELGIKWLVKRSHHIV